MADDGLSSQPPPEGQMQALVQSFAMIIASEIGDKTFLIAAILAMRHPRLVVFAGAFGSLVVMSILSAEMGHLLPTLIPKRYTQLAAAVLFLVFGAKMIKEGLEMEGGNGKIQEEMREAEEEIEGDEAVADGTGTMGADGAVIPLEDLESGQARPRANGSATARTGSRSRSNSPPPTPRTPGGSKRAAGGFKEGTRNFCSLFFGPVFVQAFVLTFLGEWGDRSQIATIALAAAHNLYAVALGTVIGHSMCTALAVIGGRYVSTKISVKHVTLGGAVLFLLFGVIYIYEAGFASGDSDLLRVPSSLSIGWRSGSTTTSAGTS